MSDVAKLREYWRTLTTAYHGVVNASNVTTMVDTFRLTEDFERALRAGEPAKMTAGSWFVAIVILSAIGIPLAALLLRLAVVCFRWAVGG